MSKRGEAIAAKMVSKIMRESGRLDKACGTREQIISTVMPIAEAIAVLGRSLDNRGKRLGEWLETDSRHLAVVEGNSGVDPHLHPESDIIRDEQVVKMRTDQTVSRQLQSIDETLRGM